MQQTLCGHSCHNSAEQFIIKANIKHKRKNKHTSVCLCKQKITLNNYELKFKGAKIFPAFFGSFKNFFLSRFSDSIS